MQTKNIAFVLAAIIGGAACTHTPAPKSEQTTPQEKVQSAPAKQNIIKKHINIPSDFSYITNLGSIDIYYTQGDFCIDVEGDSTTLSYLDARFDSNLLTVNIKTDNIPELNKYGYTSHVKMYVSCPDLKCVSICGNGKFESQGIWKTKDLQLGVLGTGAMQLEHIECTSFTLHSNKIGNVSIGKLIADEANIYSVSAAHIDVNMDVKNLAVINEGKQTMTFTGTAQNVKIKNPDDPNLKNELNQ